MGLAGESLLESNWLEPFTTSLVHIKKKQNELEKILKNIQELLLKKDYLLIAEKVKNTRLKEQECRHLLGDRLNELDAYTRHTTNLSDCLYREVIISQMRPFGDGIETFPRMVRDLANKLNKKVKLEIIGKNTPVDRDILKKLEAPIIHILSNSLDHGIESTEERLNPQQTSTRHNQNTSSTSWRNVIHYHYIICHFIFSDFISNNLKHKFKKKIMINLTQPDPIYLEIFKNLYQFIAEEMGITLQNTASSVNIKERLDFSCAIFDSQGNLVANAPHIPIHLGSMSESVKSLIQGHTNDLAPGNVYLSNNPYNGGTHLPDVTAITPVFDQENIHVLFYVASRGHQADIGGITPGSMPPNSTHIQEEGILFDNFLLIEQGIFREKELRKILADNPYPARNPEQNIADFQAQIAANNKGAKELLNMVSNYGLETVQTYMQFVQDNAEESIRKAIDVLKNGEFCYAMDNGGKIKVKITINREKRSAVIDFTGTSEQMNNNFNAPRAITQAAVLYVFRTLVDDNIPLNAGCLKPLEIIIPQRCLLNPEYPAAVVAGNVETSQVIVDSLYGALGIMAASQGTMNNFTFGNEEYQYYETVCGGSGAGIDYHGTDAVQTHMTNSRITDPEVLEMRFPVLLEEFSIRENSGGKGLYDGGNGIRRKIRFLESLTVGILANRRVIPPFGLGGGASGQVGRNWLERDGKTVESLGHIGTVNVQSGDVFVMETPGGGGYGENK
jgi:N-methylhydantoinase B